jgi:Secretion system C-terminal sorting domain
MKKIFSLILMLGFCMHFAFGQNNITGPIVQYPVYFDVSPPLRDMVNNPPPKADNSWKDGIVKNQFNIRQKPSGQVPGGLSDPNLQSKNGMIITDTTIQNFDGNTNTQGYVPPDTYGEVGPNHYFQVVNCHYSIYSKTGTLLLGPLDNSSIFNGLPNNANSGDAVVLYDEVANRWLFSQFSLPSYPNGPFYQMIAVSQTADPTGSWYRYQYTFTDMPDYPKFGVWPDAYYMSMNRFASGSGSYVGIGAVAYNRTLMLAGNPATTMIMFTKPASDEAFGWLPSDCDGPFPTGTPPNYFLYAYDGSSDDHLGIYEFHADWVTPVNATFGNFLSLPVNAFTANITGIPQPSTNRKVDPINDRMMYRLQYRKFSNHEAMVCNHTVDVSTTVAGIRWYELRKTSGAWSIYQQSTYSISDNNSRWMGSIAMDTSGNIALGYSISSATLYPSIRYTGRLKNDALNTMTIAEQGIYNGGGSQTSYSQRWGDYSGMSVDPSATATFWYTQEYYATTSGTSWKTRIASFSFATSFTVTATATPAYINLGQTSQLNVVATGGTGFFTYSWTSLPAGYNSNQQTPPPVSPTVTTKYIAHVTSGTQTKTDTVTVYINMTATATANPYTINSGSSSQLNIAATGGTGSYTYSWTSVPVGFTSTVQNPTVSPTVNTIYTAVATSGVQNASDTARVKVNMSVLATATPPSIIIGGSSQLNAVVAGGSGTYTYVWTSLPPGFNSTLQNPVVYPTTTTQYIVNVNDGSQTKGDTVQVTVTLNSLNVTTTATPSSICTGNNSQLNVTATGGTLSYTYSWTSIPVGFTSNVRNPVVQPIVTTIYIAQVNDGVSTVTDSTTVTVTQLSTASAGNDTTFCVTIGQIQLNGQSTNSSSVLWTTSGDGTFLNPSSLTAIYYPGANDKTTLHVNLTLTASPVPPCTPQATSIRHITFDICNGIPETTNEIFSVSIRPNPSFGTINLVISGLKTGEVRVSIMDLSGKTRLQESFTTTGSKVNRKMDLSTFQRGVYFVKIETDTHVKTEKLILE